MKPSTLLRLAVVFALSTIAATAGAQARLYFNPVFTRVSNSTPDYGPFAFLGQGGTSQIFGGVAFGGSYVVLHDKKYDLGIDVREQIQHGNSASLSSFLVGPHLEFKPVTHDFRPYVQVSVGAGRTKAPLSGIHVTKLEVDAWVGVDKKLSKSVDWRVLEVGYGSVTTMSSTVERSNTGIPAAGLLHVSTGLTFRVH